MKEKKTATVLAGIYIKDKNRRIGISLQDSGDDKFFVITTKRLVDFKKREITETNNIYSLDTFLLMRDAMNEIMGNSTVGNKFLLRDLKAFNDRLDEEGMPTGHVFIKGVSDK